MPRWEVDIVVPFRGTPEELASLRARLAGLALNPGDTLLVVDNTPGSAQAPDGAVPVLRAGAIETPGYARNRGAERGRAPWLLFLDADTEAPADLLERYFEPAPAPSTAILAGGVRDAPAGGGVARYMHLMGGMSQDNTFRFGPRFGFPQTANAAVRREAFEAVGGFREDVRAAEDADLTYRLRAGGWEVERREAAAVIHRSRPTAWRLAMQRAGHGAGAAWLHAEHGGFPPRRRPGLIWWGARFAAKGLTRAALRRDRDTALRAVLEPLEQISFELGRSLPNERPLPRRSLWRRVHG